MTATAEVPGADKATDETPFPCSSFQDAARHMRRPFTVEAVKFKPQSVTKTGKTICVAYIDARLVVERLNLIVPHLWYDEYEPLGAKHLICRLTIDGITRPDIGEGFGKALYSDALKRAAVKFGIGVSLYAVPSMILPGRVEYLYPDSAEYRKLRDHYARWLAAHGRQAFGDPLDHGDAPDAQGDHEADAAPPGPDGVDPGTGEVTSTEDAGPKLASPSDIRTIYQQANERLSACELLAVLLEAHGKPMEDVTEIEALARVRDVIKTLPADKVPVVLAKVA